MTSCGTLIINRRGEILLCHVTGTRKWDIPKGLQDPGETTLEAAMREMREETGLVFEAGMFDELGRFDYRPEKDLHLYRVRMETDMDSLDHLVCTSHFTHHVTGEPTPEVDGFCWATRDEIPRRCWPRMAARLTSLDW
ncbi:NUDIX hydrolase [Noviherbaspirillum galbum]|uniref:NUDIX hydrolase n=1 Tax=Noviherbaspirillum galbum TaxID=2709383 RepID=A0A6B3SG05_9BURK|nr:NUDIX hydrolase [Noviherbaspirillum galbum]NEX59523.1 NUDIX hydrolase [Noviherbaspirillum galbum]